MAGKFSYTAGIAVCLFVSTGALAESNNMLKMYKFIEQKQASEQLKAEAIDLGKDRAVLCNQCHGADGNSTKPEVPNLASQNTKYLLEQIEKFSNGTRKNFVMNTLSKNFSSMDKVHLAIFYASMPVKARPVDAVLVSKAQPLYLSKCATCHGEKGIGKEKFARLAGQQPTYVKNTLRHFRAAANNAAVASRSDRRSPVMESVTKTLSDQDIDMLADYIAQLQ